MCKLRLLGGIALLVTALVACDSATASAPPDPPTPSADPTASVMIDWVNPAAIDGLTTRTRTEREPGRRHVYANYPVLPEAPRLTSKLDRVVREQLESFAPADPSTRHLTPELNIDWRIAAHNPETIAVRLRTGHYTTAGWTESLRTIWYDRRHKRALDSVDLVEDDAALARLTDTARRALSTRPAVHPYAIRPDAHSFDSLAFNRDGDLILEFDGHEVATRTSGRVAVAVPGRDAAALLSEVGLRAQAAARTAASGQVGVPGDGPPDMSNVPADRDPEAPITGPGAVDCSRTKCVALTFDDGPGPDTGRLLDALAQHRIPATFFCVGNNAAAQPRLLERMRREGHLVASHTWSHRNLTTLPSSRVWEQLGRAQQLIGAATGLSPALLRPPYGATNDAVAETARRMGLAIVKWDVDARMGDDDSARIARRVIGATRPGSIVLMHDVNPAAVDAVPEVLTELTARGYTFVTVPELYGPHGMRAGQTYYAGPAAPTGTTAPDERGGPAAGP
jgi:peptidoglycan/xylan/chitin deacetylase (PgdA/CDA1 family)